VWSPQLSRVEADVETLTAGARGRVVGPLGLWAAFTIEDVDRRARRWTWRVVRGPLALTLRHGVDRRPSATGSSTWLELRGPLPVILGYAPIARYALHRLVNLPCPSP
jgi:hypothetical protein